MTSNYRASDEWQGAERALTVSLGFRVSKREDHVTAPYIIQHGEYNTQGQWKVRTQAPVSKDAYDLWCEAVRYRIEHDAACKLAWELYGAAMNVTTDNFNGMPSGGPVEAVRAERARLKHMAEDIDPIYSAVQAIQASDGSYVTEIAGVVIVKAGHFNATR